MPTIVFANPKGGCGKSTSALTVVTNTSEQTILDDIDNAAERSRFVIVDLEGVGSRRMAYAISRADRVLIPMQKQRLDADMAVQAIREITLESKHQKRQIPFSIMFTRTKVVAESKVARRTARDIYEQAGIDLDPEKVTNLPKAIENARAFAQAVIDRFKATRMAA